MVFPVVMYGCECWTVRKAESLQRFSREILWRRDRLPTPIFLGFLGDSDSKESTCNAGDLGSVPGLGRSTGGGHGNPLQYSCLENTQGQRGLVGYRPWSQRVGHDWVTKYTDHVPVCRTFKFDYFDFLYNNFSFALFKKSLIIDYYSFLK